MDSILHAYCDKNGHRVILISRKILGSTGDHSFLYGFEYNYNESYKCTVCGRTRSCSRTGYSYQTVKKYVMI